MLMGLLPLLGLRLLELVQLLLLPGIRCLELEETLLDNVKSFTGFGDHEQLCADEIQYRTDVVKVRRQNRTRLSWSRLIAVPRIAHRRRTRGDE